MSITLAAAMLTSAFVSLHINAGAAGGVSYIDRSWNGASVAEEVKSCPSYSTIGSQNDLTIGNGGWYVVNGDATISNRVTVTGTANIILLSGTLTCSDGIRLSNGNTLNIYPGSSSEGTITAKIKGDDYANIGGNENETCGTLNFHGGTLNAENGSIWTYGAAIGGGRKGGAGDLSFYGGTVNAKNNGSGLVKFSTGAAIGSGGFEENKAPTGSVNIYGGEITARCDRYSTAAAIGGGEESKCPPINILGGKVTATSSEGAGIGTGQEGSSDTVTIRNAVIDAEGDLGAAIGSGEDCDAGNIIIESSIVTAKVCAEGSGKRNEAAAIGGGNSGDSTYIKIDKSVVSAYASKYGAGIGGGDEGSGGTIEITDSNIFACSGRGGAGIGGGDEKGCSSISIIRSYVVATTASEVNTAEKRFASDYGSEFDKIALYLANNPATTEEMASYAAGTLLAMLIDNLAEGTRTGAGIGSGHDGKAESILIEDSVVTATGGDCAAAIGGGISGGFGTIDIKNSKIHARSVTDGSGIGSGESGSCGTINITDNSIVVAEGGPYGAGIGGGDDSSAGTINIHNSSVRAYGGTDAAGIGGGEGGGGGTMDIYNSDVYAQGKEYGAGIGGGEDCGVDLVVISGKKCNVVAVAGGDGNSVAIGNGDYNSFFHSRPYICVALYSGLKVRAGSSSGSTSVYTEKSRYAAVWDNKYAKLFVCEHENIEWRIYGKTKSDHIKYCSDCGEQLSDTAPHDWNEKDICNVCGAVRKKMDLNFVEKNESGQEVRSTVTVYESDYYALPECKNAPDGYGFLSWKVTYNNGTYYFHAPGEQLIPESFAPVIEAIYLPLKETTYIDESGKERTVMAKQVSALETTEFLLVVTDGWYVVDRTLDMWGRMRVHGDVRFIVEDGCSLSAAKFAERYSGEIIWHDPAEYSVFSLYGQKNQTGVLDAGYYRATASFSTFRQYGAVFMADAAGFDKSGSIYAGTFETSSDSGTKQGEIGIYGGKVHLARLAFNEDSEPAMEIGWTRLSDHISLVKFVDRGSVKIRDGQAFKDDNGTIYRDSITTEQQEALSADINTEKTLIPYIEHEYTDPEWIWDNYYTNATAVFRCRDCGETQEIKARVTYSDSGKNRTSTASCIFYGDEYTTTQTKQIIFDITAASAVHGTVTANKATAGAGDNIKLTLTLDDGYSLAGLYYTDAEGNTTAIKGSSFEMPASNVTVSAEFSTLVPATEPYIDADGEYRLGNVAYFDINGKYYSVNEGGSAGEELDTVELSYFDFELLSDDTYWIKCYTGPMGDLERLEIPKTFKGKAVTVLGDVEVFMKGTGDQRPFALILNENISVIQGIAFFLSMLTSVEGDTSGLSQIKGNAFLWTNAIDENAVTMNLDYPRRITVDSRAFGDENITVRLKHTTTLSSEGGASSLNYVFTDAHTYGDPTWTWANDYSTATAKFTCTDPRCSHEETANAAVTSKTEGDTITYTATAEFNGTTYTDQIGLVSYSVTVASVEHGSVTADKSKAYKGEEVTLTVTPDIGYKLDSLTVKDADNNEITVTDNKFTMPESNVTVSAVFAERALNIHVGGVGITGENCSDILGDGTASYDFATNTLTLTDAEIEIAQRSGVRSGIRYNEASDKPFNIVLNGNNKIVDKIDNGTSDIFGIALYAAVPGFTVSGGGTLDIELDPNQKGVGIHVRKALTLSNTTVTVNAANTGDLAAVDLCYSDTYLILTDGARMFIRSGNTALASNSSNIQNLHIADGCILEAVSDTQAFNGNIHLTDKHPDVRVNTAAASDGATLWNGSSPALTEYKYIRIENEPPLTEPSAEAKHVKDYTVDGYVASLWTITVTPGTYAVESLNAVMNGKTSDTDMKTSTVISDGPVFFAVAVEALEKDIRSISAVINGNETVIK